MTPIGSDIGAVVRINGLLLGAFCLAFVAWLIWPDSIINWGLGAVSIIFGYCAFICVFDALKAMAQLRTRARLLAEITGDGRTAKNAGLASGDVLDRAGMTDE